MPALGALPPKLKPATEKVPAISGKLLVMAVTCAPIFSVYSSEAPVGA